MELTSLLKSLNNLSSVSACETSPQIICALAQNCLTEIKQLKLEKKDTDELKGERELWKRTVNELTEWQRVSIGTFGVVYRAQYRQAVVTVKVPNSNVESAVANDAFYNEAKILRRLNHGNIGALVAVGLLDSDMNEHAKKGSLCYVLEYWNENLESYIANRQGLNKGLSLESAWYFCQQLVNAINYLHSRMPRIANLAVQPANILLNTSAFPVQVRLSEFCWALDEDSFRERLHASIDGWLNADMLSLDEADLSADSEFDIFLAADIYSFGLTASYAATGVIPEKSSVGFVKISKPSLTATSSEEIETILMQCSMPNWKERPTSRQLVEKAFAKDNPFKLKSLHSEFFSRGFLTGTEIFVTDSCISENFKGCVLDNSSPVSYSRENIVCKAMHDSRLSFPENKTLLGLRHLAIDRPGDEERQVLELSFQFEQRGRHKPLDGNIVSNNTKKDKDGKDQKKWFDLSAAERLQQVPCKSNVLAPYSVSFRVCLSLLVGGDSESTRKFAVTRVKGKDGSVRTSCWLSELLVYSKDYVTLCNEDESGKEESWYTLSLWTAISKLLRMKLNIELTEEDHEAIRLQTLFLDLKYYQWGMSGLVDLTLLERYKQRPWADIVNSLTTKDVEWIDFSLDDVVAYVRANASRMDDCSKLNITNTLEAYFGVALVERAFASFT